MKGLTTYAWASLILVIIGGLNLGLVGLFSFSLLTSLLGNFLGRVLFIIIGVAAGYLVYLIYLEKTKTPPPAV